MNQSNSNTQKEADPEITVAPEISVQTFKSSENTQSPQVAIILAPKKVENNVSMSADNIKGRELTLNYVTVGNKGETFTETAVQQSKSPEPAFLKANAVPKTELQNIPSLNAKRIFEQNVSNTEVSKPAVQPKEEKRWQPPSSKRPMTGITFREINNYRRKLRERLHIPSKRELMRHHLPYHVAFCYELEEDGFPDAANFIRYLIDFDIKRREKAGRDLLLQLHPKLKNNKPYLERLGIGLSEAAEAKVEGNTIQESNCLLQLALFFTKENKEWWWLAGQLFEQSIQIIKNVRRDGGKHEAHARYCYGHFLINQMSDPEQAKEHLQVAYSLSIGKPWQVSEPLESSPSLLFVNICNLLYEALVQAAINIREEDPKIAIRLCNLAMQRANEGCPEGIPRIMLELGICMLAGEDIYGAIKLFHKLINLQHCTNNVSLICNAHLQVAICYKQLGQFEKVLHHLEMFKSIVESNERTDLLAGINRYLGEFHLNMDSAHLAKPYLETSFTLYYQLGIKEEMEQSRALAAIAAGHRVLAEYVHLICQCDNPRNSQAFTKLLHWKISNISFLEAENLPFPEGSSDYNTESENASDVTLLGKDEAI